MLEGTRIFQFMTLVTNLNVSTRTRHGYRARAVMDLARSPFARDWGGIGQIAIKPGIKDGRAQIVIEPAPDGGESAKKGKGKSKSNGSDIVEEINETLGLTD